MVPNARRLLLIALVALGLLRAIQTVLLAAPLGVPGLVGGDYVAYRTAGQLVASGESHALYDLDRQRQVEQSIEASAGVADRQRFTLAFDNPPPAALLTVPLALLPPRISFVLWTLVNIALCLLSVGLFLRKQGRWHAAALPTLGAALLFVPVLLGFFYGQMIGPVLLLYTLAVSWLAEDADGRAGVALALLAAIKPQYAAVLLLLVLLGGRRRALLSAALTGGALLLLSLALVGPTGLLAYRQELALLDPYAGDSTYLIDPALMINWRAVVLTLAPGLAPTAGFIVTNLLALATIGGAALVWQGRRTPGTSDFAWQVLAATAATLLASYHSHAHGATLLLVPFLLFLRQPEGLPSGVQRLTLASFWPPLLLLAAVGPAILALRPLVSFWLIGCLIASLALALRWRFSPDSALRPILPAPSVVLAP